MNQKSPDVYFLERQRSILYAILVLFIQENKETCRFLCQEGEEIESFPAALTLDSYSTEGRLNYSQITNAHLNGPHHTRKQENTGDSYLSFHLCSLHFVSSFYVYLNIFFFLLALLVDSAFLVLLSLILSCFHFSKHK